MKDIGQIIKEKSIIYKFEKIMKINNNANSNEVIIKYKVSYNNMDSKQGIKIQNSPILDMNMQNFPMQGMGIQNFPMQGMVIFGNKSSNFFRNFRAKI